ncbi:MAG: M48 family metalloprotease [Candidatus Riflebacteria bacterium]
MRKIRLVLSVALLLLAVSQAQAANPIVKYFSRLLDESRAEIEVGRLLEDQFLRELGDAIKPSDELSAKIRKIAENTSRPEVNYRVFIIDSDVADELVFPGGALFLTTGLLSTAVEEFQLEFILSRNLMHMVLRHPMKLLKSEGLYAGLLNQLKLAPDYRDQTKIREMTRDYLRNQAKMDHKKVDLQGILLLASPEKGRKAAIALLQKFTGRIWPVLPMDTGNLPGRIDALEKLKLPE